MKHMKLKSLILALLASFACLPANHAASSGPIRVLFLGHEAEHHPSNLYYPMIAQALGRDAIYFDYVTTVGEALDDASHLARYDALLLYANHETISPQQWQNLLHYVENGGGFIPVHCASWCFSNEPGFDQLVGGRFAHHQTGTFKVKTILPNHPAIQNVPELEAWDETYVHSNHNPKDRTILQVREVNPGGDNISEPEPWTWIRTQGKGRVFYTASGHDQRVWTRDEFHQLLKHGILWAVGDHRRSSYEQFLTSRKPLQYEKRDNIPNYERRPEPLKYQLPLAPEDSLQYTRIPVGFRLELFASEPDIINPIAMAWDERGRLWVAETVDYPNELTTNRVGRDNIKILEDTNGDGRCDKVTVFATGLNVPTSIVFAHGGVIVSQAPDFLFFKDTNGDDIADVREILNTGWGIADTHAGPSNLRYGLNNRVWGTVGYSGFSGTRNGKDYRFGSGVFNMNADGSDVTFLHQFNNNTWGLGFNAAGDVFGSTANANPAFFCAFPASAYTDTPGMSAKMIADSPNFHPITPNVRQVDAFGQYTAGAGYSFATSDRFPPSWQDSMAFISGPTGHLLGMFKNIPDGSGYKAINRFSVIASADEWFSPVSAEVGPDGNLWVADWYNFIIQHNPTPSPERGGYRGENGKGNAHINPNRDRQHGRIYRLVWEDAAQPAPRLSLDQASNEQLLQTLSHPNQFWRLTAQRLLIQKNEEATIQPLRRQVTSGGIAAVHALWTLHGLGKLDREIHQAALLNTDPVLRRNAIQALGTSADDIQLFFDTAVIASPDLQARRAAFTKMAQFPKHPMLAVAIPNLLRDETNRKDDWLLHALKVSAHNQGVPASFSTKPGPNLLPNSSFEDTNNNQPVNWRPATYSDRGQTTFTLDNKVAHSGNNSVRITSEQGADVSWLIQAPVKPSTEYRLSGWVRTENLKGARGAQFNIHGVGDAVTTAVKDTSDWTRLEVTFNSANLQQVTINCLFGGWGTSRGTAWFDDVALEEMIFEISNEEIEVEPGNASRGRQIFREHPIASCIRCHRLEGEGGFVGPYLDGIAKRQKEDYLRESLLDPQAKIAEGFPAEISPMPPFGVLLTPQDIEDLVAFLLTLEADPPPGSLVPPPEISYE